MREILFRKYLETRYSKKSTISTTMSDARVADKRIKGGLDNYFADNIDREIPDVLWDETNPSASSHRGATRRYRDFLLESEGLNIADRDDDQDYLASHTNQFSIETDLQNMPSQNPNQLAPNFVSANNESQKTVATERNDRASQFNSSQMLGPAQVAEVISDNFYNDRFDLSERRLRKNSAWSLMPEVEAERQLRALGESERSIRVFLTLISAMDRVRESEELWRAGVDFFKQHPEVFKPEHVSAISKDTLNVMLREAKVSGRFYNKDAEYWHKIACSLVSGSGAVCRLIDSGDGDAEELLEELYKEKSRYPALSGPKISLMWIRIMVTPGRSKIKRIDSIDVAVDVQVRRATENLGMSDTMGLELNKECKQLIQFAWKHAVQSANIGGPPEIAGTCAALDPALWFFGKYGCSHCEKMGRRLLISNACRNCRLPVS